MQVEHEATDACAPDHCHWHSVDEPGTGYILCGECGHLYRTASELRRAYRREVMRGPRYFSGPPWWCRAWRALTIRASKIYFCQECIHDF